MVLGPKVKLMCGIALCAIVLPASQTIAQTRPSNSPQLSTGTNTVTEVVVTARKRTEDVQSVPVALTALSGAQLKEQSVKSVIDLQGQVPSLMLQQGADDPQTVLFLMRGREQNDTALTLDASVGLYIDGLYVARTLGMAGALVDIDRVEILRGPQGTLYGKNTTGGAISIFTHDPTEEFGGSIDVTAGNYGAWNGVGILNAPLTNNLAARIVVQRGVHDGYGHNSIGEDLGSEDSQYYRGKLKWTGSGNWQATLTADYGSNKTGGADYKIVGLQAADPVAGTPEGGLITMETVLEHGGDPSNPVDVANAVNFLNGYIAKGLSNFYDNGGAQHSFSRTWRANALLDVSGDLSDNLQFRSITGYQRLHREEHFGFAVPVDFFLGHPREDDEYYSQEFQLLGAAGPTVNWVAGLYGDHEKGRTFTGLLGAPALSAAFGLPNTTINDNPVVNTSLAAFAQAIWEFIPDWRLTGGVRYSYDQRRIDANAYVGDDPGPYACVVPAGPTPVSLGGPAQCPRRFKSDFGRPSWLVSLDHKLTPDVLVYAKVAEGYRSGGINANGSDSENTFAAFRPETNLEYEAGVKSEFFGRRLRLNLAAYRDEYSNLQVSTAVPTGPGTFATVVSNAATATIQGVEAEAEAVLGHGLSLNGSATYTDAHYDKFLDIDQSTGLLTLDRSGEAFTVPKWMLSLGGRYVRPTGLGDLTLRVDYNWKSSIVLDPTAATLSQVTQKSVGLLDARINLHLDAAGVDIAVFGKNITGEKYYDQVFGGFEANGANFGFAAPPATYGVEVTKTFGR